MSLNATSTYFLNISRDCPAWAAFFDVWPFLLRDNIQSKHLCQPKSSLSLFKLSLSIPAKINTLSSKSIKNYLGLQNLSHQGMQLLQYFGWFCSYCKKPETTDILSCTLSGIQDIGHSDLCNKDWDNMP